jgi:AraC-like DNA-binding protein
MSERTMRRMLEQERTSFRGLLDEIRQGRADALLAQGRTVSEVGYLLGFATVSAFSRAYKRWRGVPPRTSRRRSR